MKRCFLIVLLAMFAILPFSCSSDGFKEPLTIKGSDGSEYLMSETKEVVKCVVEKAGGKYCYEISDSACKIIGGEKDESEMCISFTCKWDKETVKYGRNSTLSFNFDSEGHEDCSLKINYGNSELDTINYTISSSAFPGLSYSKDASIVVVATVTCDGQPYIQNCGALKVEHITAPEARCSWTPNKVKYGLKSSISFDFESQSVADEEHCALEKISYGTKTFKRDSSYTISASMFPGLSPSKDTSVVATANITCGNQDKWNYPLDCEALEIDSVPGPKLTGAIFFKKFDYDSSFFIGKTITKDSISNTMAITNKVEAECGDIEIRITGSPAKLGTPVKATAVVYCKYTDTLELASISAEVLPDPKIGDCEIIGNKTTMRSDDTLKLSISVDNSYGRCGKIEYTLSSSSGGSGYVESNSFSLANYGNRELNNIYARVTCGTTQTPKKCPTVSVANYKYFTNCKKDTYNVDFSIGKTIVDFACPDSRNGKNDNGEDEPWNAYYINCNGKDKYTVTVEGGRIKPADGYGRSYNFFPDTDPIPVGNLYRYPHSIVIDAQETITCGIW